MLHSTHPSPFFFFFPPRHILGRSLLLCASPILTLLFPPPSFLLLRRKAEGGGDRPKVSFVRSIEMRQPSRESGHPFPSSGNTGVEWKRQSGASGGRGGGGGAESGYTAPKTERRGRATHFPFPRKAFAASPFRILSLGIEGPFGFSLRVFFLATLCFGRVVPAKLNWRKSLKFKFSRRDLWLLKNLLTLSPAFTTSLRVSSFFWRFKT